MGEIRRYVVDAETLSRGDLREIIDPIWVGSNFYEGPAEYDASLRPFTRGQRFVWAVLWYDQEVCNGGHEQFFANSTGAVWPDALEGLEAAGLEATLALLREAVARFPKPPSRVRTERERQLAKCKVGFDDLDDRYYALSKAIDLDAALLEYVASQCRDISLQRRRNRPRLR